MANPTLETRSSSSSNNEHNNNCKLWQQCIHQKRLCLISVGTVYVALLLFMQLTLVISKDAKSTDSTQDPIELQCPPCSQIFCTPKNPKRLHCKGGVTKGICNCCPVCAKVEGESCGGLHNFLGKCDSGLTCVSEDTSTNNLNDVLKSDYSKRLARTAKGICKRGKKVIYLFFSHKESMRYVIRNDKINVIMYA